jgi:hypothetical protein
VQKDMVVVVVVVVVMVNCFNGIPVTVGSGFKSP